MKSLGMIAITAVGLLMAVEPAEAQICTNCVMAECIITIGEEGFGYCSENEIWGGGCLLDYPNQCIEVTAAVSPDGSVKGSTSLQLTDGGAWTKECH